MDHLMISTEIYKLDGKNTDIIPVPHDCVIKDILKDDDYLIIVFEDDISYHDAIKAIRPEAQTLTMRFHLEYGGLTGIYQYRKTKHHEGYMHVKSLRKLMKECNHNITYLYHYVAYHQIIVELCANNSILLTLNAVDLEYEWSQKKQLYETGHSL